MARPLTASRLNQLIQKIYPRQLAGSWDNTGLLLESSFTRVAQASTTPTRILLCIDLTTKVCDEALRLDGCAHIVAYHPIIFSGLKSLTLANSQQRSLLRLAAAGISVYCPHTSIDAIKGGVNDMLVDIFRTSTSVTRVQCVEACKTAPPGFEDSGIGRVIQLSEFLTIEQAIGDIKKTLGLTHVQLARASSARNENGSIQSVGICAGSGGSVLKGANVDLILTGELSHHEQLAFIEQGTHIILCGHSNTERPFLPTMRTQMQKLFAESEPTEIIVSAADASPFETV